MAKRRLQLKNIARIAGRSAGLLLALLLVVALMLWSTGALKAKIKPGSVLVEAGKPFNGATAIAAVQSISENLRAVGTISPIAPVLLTPRIVGRIVYSRLIAGTNVKKGEVLVRLDSAQLKAQLAQTAAAVLLAKAQLRQAIIDQKRDKTLLATGSIARSKPALRPAIRAIFFNWSRRFAMIHAPDVKQSHTHDNSRCLFTPDAFASNHIVPEFSPQGKSP